MCPIPKQNRVRLLINLGQALQRVFDEIIDAFRGMFDRIARIQCSFGPPDYLSVAPPTLNLPLTLQQCSSSPSTCSIVSRPLRSCMPRVLTLTTASARPSVLPPRRLPDPLKRDCEQLAHSLRMFEDSWHLVNMACSMLLDKVTFAGKLTVRLCVPPGHTGRMLTNTPLLLPIVGAVGVRCDAAHGRAGIYATAGMPAGVFGREGAEVVRRCGRTWTGDDLFSPFLFTLELVM